MKSLLSSREFLAYSDFINQTLAIRDERVKMGLPESSMDEEGPDDEESVEGGNDDDVFEDIVRERPDDSEQSEHASQSEE